MIKEIAVIGHPSLCGGADTELLDQIRLWNLIGIKVHIIPTKNNKESRIDLSDYNVEIHEYMDFKECKGLHTFSFCNPVFLDKIDIIKKYAKTTIWANCMTFNFESELEAHKKGLIDFFLYQTKHQYNNLAGNLIKTNKEKFIPYIFIPYFDSSRFQWVENRDYSVFKFGRISRSDISKYSKYQFSIYSKLNFPKEGTVLGWKDELRNYFDSNDLINSNCKFYKEKEISQNEFYKRCNVVCMSTSTFENLPRIGFESIYSGSVLITDNRGGWTTLIDHNKTGYLCNNEKEFINCCTDLYNNPDKCKQFANNALIKLENQFSKDKSISSWLAFLNGIDNYLPK